MEVKLDPLQKRLNVLQKNALYLIAAVLGLLVTLIVMCFLQAPMLAFQLTLVVPVVIWVASRLYRYVVRVKSTKTEIVEGIMFFLSYFLIGVFLSLKDNNNVVGAVVWAIFALFAFIVSLYFFKKIWGDDRTTAEIQAEFDTYSTDWFWRHNTPP
jgi:hypothetical protein